MERIEVKRDMRLGKINPRYAPELGIERVSSFDNLQMWVDEFERGYKEVYITDARNNIVSKISIDRARGNVWSVHMIAIDSKYQGFGIAPTLYYWMMFSLGISLKAGSQQSPGGRGIWYELASMPEVNVLVRRRGSEFVIADRDDEEREVCSDEFDCYESKSSEVIAALAR